MEPIAGPSRRNNPPINYVLGRKKTQVLVYDNKQYSKHKIYKNGNALWRCIKKGCNGLLTLSSTEEVVKIKGHKCASKVLETQIKETMLELEQQVVSTMEPIPTIYKQKLHDTLDRGLNLVSDMPRFKNVKSGLYNKRNKSLGVNRLFAKSPIDVQVPQQFQDFVLADYNDGKRRILLFATQKSRQELESCGHIFCDGTFKCAPKPFLQIYSIHGEVQNIVKPLGYALLHDKKKSTYKILFKLLKTTIPKMQVKVFTSDFEEAAVRSFTAVFPNAQIAGCYFHFKKALKKKSKDLDLDKNSIHRKHVALCMVLPFLPLENLDEAWLYIMSECPQGESISRFNDYMVTQWFEHKLWHDKWSCYNEKNKTNNYTESHYSDINKMFNKNRAINLAKLLDFFQKNCNNYAEIREKMGFSDNQKYAEIKNNLIENIIKDYKNGLISVGHCLEKLRF